MPLEYPYVDWKTGSIFLPSDLVEFNSARHGTIKRAKRMGLLTAPIVVRRRAARRVSRLLYLPVLHIWLQSFLETFRECVRLTMQGPDLRGNEAAVCPTYYQQPLTASVRSSNSFLERCRKFPREALHRGSPTRGTVSTEQYFLVLTWSRALSLLFLQIVKRVALLIS